jgi:TetR/AcrR family transcriptional regulator, lmrAB and yxaGH operons repressor
MSTQGDQTRKKIIDTVIELLKVKGYNGIGLQEIVKESGAPKGSLYFHFPGGKDEIVETAIKQQSENIDKLLRMLFLGSADIATAIKMVMMYSINELESSGYTKGCPIGTTVLDPVSISNTILESCARCFSLMKDVIAERLIKDGFVAVEAEKQATFILSSLEGAIILSKAQRNTEPLKIIAEQLSIFFAHQQTE